MEDCLFFYLQEKGKNTMLHSLLPLVIVNWSFSCRFFIISTTFLFHNTVLDLYLSQLLKIKRYSPVLPPNKNHPTLTPPNHPPSPRTAFHFPYSTDHKLAFKDKFDRSNNIVKRHKNFILHNFILFVSLP